MSCTEVDMDQLQSFYDDWIAEVGRRRQG